MLRPAAFAYPVEPHVRLHGPTGYKDYRRYLNWLRDEFGFRCVYCLTRETWIPFKKLWHVDHFIAKSLHPDGKLEYDNLVLACATCNHTKAANRVLDPCKVGYGTCVEVHDDGTIHPLNQDGVDLIEVMGLDGDDYNDFRHLIVGLLRDLSGKSESFLKWFGHPRDLPDLSSEPLPLGNTRPEGVNDSYFERCKRGELPPITG